MTFVVDAPMTPPRALARPDGRDRAWRALQKSWADVHVFLTREFILDWVSPSITYVAGWRPEEMVGRNYEDFMHPDLAEEGLRIVMDMFEHPDGFDPADGEPPAELRALLSPAHVMLRTKDGRFLPVETRGNVHLNDPDIDGFHIVLRDVSDLDAQDRLLSLIAHDAPIEDVSAAIIRTVVTQVPGTYASLVFPCAETVDVPAELADDESLTVEVLAHVNDVMDRRELGHLPLRAPTKWRTAWTLPLVTPDGERSLAALVVWTESDGPPVSWLASILGRLARLGSIGLTRISDLEHLKRVAAIDPLTGLANRREFERSLLTACSEPVGRWALLYIDLDGFKLVNDVYGHAVGDEVLRETARRLSTVVRRGDIVARMGGDEFTILCPALPTQLEAQRLADRVLSAMDEPMRVPGVNADLEVGASVGFATTDLPSDVPRLLGRADVHMYANKASRRAARRAEV